MKQGPYGNLTLEDFVKLTENVLRDSRDEIEDATEFESDRVSHTKDIEHKTKVTLSSSQQTVEKSTKKTSSRLAKPPRLQNHSRSKPFHVRPKRSQAKLKNAKLDGRKGKSTS